jgi:hypothetical protein
MKKTIIYIALLFAAMLIAGTIDEQTRILEQQTNTIKDKQNEHTNNHVKSRRINQLN